MNLNQVAELFKEIVEKCPELDGKNFVIMIPDIPPPSLTIGYELVIKNIAKNFNEKTLEKLRDIVAREKLKIEQRPTSIMIFTPNPKPIP